MIFARICFVMEGACGACVRMPKDCRVACASELCMEMLAVCAKGSTHVPIHARKVVRELVGNDMDRKDGLESCLVR